MFTSLLHRYPFFRLLCPWMIGLPVGEFLFHQGYFCTAAYMWLYFVLTWVGMAVLYKKTAYASRNLFGVGVFLSLFALGATWMNTWLQQGAYAFPRQRQVYTAYLLDTPEEKPKTLRCWIHLVATRDSQHTQPVHKQAFLYIPKDSAARSLRAGDAITVYTRFALPDATVDSLTFDYGRYLQHKQIAGTAYAASTQWRYSGHHPLPGLVRHTQLARQHLLAYYQSFQLSADNYALLSALTVGYKKALSSELRATFSEAGVSHILALSGLHIGILYALGAWLLSRLPLLRRRSTLRKLLLVLLLWAFAYFTGLSASVVRSVTMFSLLALFSLGRRNGQSLNTLFITAFFMLAVHPGWLFDVGFQLSFAAVAAIFLFHRPLYQQWQPTNPLLRYAWGILVMSVVAQLGTLPLVLHYFGTFPVYFLLANLLIVPLVSLILYTAIACCLLSLLPLSTSWLSALLNSQLTWLSQGAAFIQQLPLAVWRPAPVGILQVILLYLLLLLFLITLRRPTSRHILLTLSSCVLLLSLRLSSQFTGYFF